MLFEKGARVVSTVCWRADLASLVLADAKYGKRHDRVVSYRNGLQSTCNDHLSAH
jgi:hypothetical protein